MRVEHLQIDVRREPDRVVLVLHGELDLASAPLLQSAIEQSAGEGEWTVLDMEDLQFIDSTGLRIILRAHQQAGEQGRELALTRVQQQVQRLLSITGVGKHLQSIDVADEKTLV